MTLHRSGPAGCWRPTLALTDWESGQPVWKQIFKADEHILKHEAHLGHVFTWSLSDSTLNSKTYLQIKYTWRTKYSWKNIAVIVYFKHTLPTKRFLQQLNRISWRVYSMSMYTWSKVSILRVSKWCTDRHLPTKGQETLELPTKKVSLHCEGTRYLKTLMIMSHFDLLMLQILPHLYPKGISKFLLKFCSQS